VFCGDNKGFLHVIDIAKGEKLTTFQISDHKKIVGLNTNGLYCTIIFEDGQVTINDV